jgi:hypothetical protein
MKILVLSAAIATTLLGVLPASAQVVIQQERGDRAVVRDRGSSDRVVIRSGDRNDGMRHRVVRRSHAECRVVKVRTRLPNGNVIIKTRRSC